MLFSASLTFASSLASRLTFASSSNPFIPLNAAAISMVPSFGDGLCENTIVSPLGGAAIKRGHFSLRLRFLASRSRFATSERMHRVITSLTASSAHLWMSSLAMRLSMNCSMPSFGIFFGSDR